MSRDQSGLTIVELVISVSVVLVALIVAYELLYAAQVSWMQDSAKMRGIQATDVAIASLSRALRGPVAQPPLPAVSVAKANEIEVYSDINGDAIPERVHYSLTGGSLRMRVAKLVGSPAVYGEDAEAVITKDLANDASHPLFKYFDDSQNEFTPVTQSDRDRIKRVKISPYFVVRGSEPVSIETDITLRNMQ